MSRRLFTLLTAIALMVVLLPAAALANGNNGQAIGQDPARLALTKCSNAGADPELESGAGLFTIRSLLSECLETHFLGRYTYDELKAIEAQSTCIGFFPFFWVCEIDPGNSAAHNANNN